MRKIIYAGSFDPLTNGHSWLIDEALLLFDEVIVIIAQNSAKKYYFSLEDRKSFIEKQYKNKRVKVVILQNEYVAQYAKENNIFYMLRGLRNSVDFEFETDVYNMNQIIASEVKTVYLRSPAHITEISSSKVKSLIGPPRWQKHISSWVNPYVISGFSKSIYRERLKKYWDKLIPYADQDFETLLEHYSEPHRFYHTAEHLMELFSKTDTIKEAQTSSILWSIFFHDLVYNPLQKDNEELSAKLWTEFAGKQNLDPELIKKVETYILATKTHQNVDNDPELQLFLDLDLSVLGSDESRFNRYEDEIRWEYSMIPFDIYEQERKKIMKKLANNTFKTEIAKKLWSKQAKHNLKDYLDN